MVEKIKIKTETGLEQKLERKQFQFLEKFAPVDGMLNLLKGLYQTHDVLEGEFGPGEIYQTVYITLDEAVTNLFNNYGINRGAIDYLIHEEGKTVDEAFKEYFKEVLDMDMEGH